MRYGVGKESHAEIDRLHPGHGGKGGKNDEGHEGRLHERSRRRECRLQQRLRHDARQQRRHRRPLEGLRGPEQGHGAEDQRHGEPPHQHPRGEESHGQGLDDLTRQRDAAPVEAVGYVPDEKGQDQHGQKLRQPDESKIVGVVRLVVDQPA